MKNKILTLTALLAVSGSASARILINEIHRRTPATTNSMVSADPSSSGDENAEFIELISTDGTTAVQQYCTHDGTATGLPLTILFLTTDGSKSYGRVKEVWKLVIPGENGSPDTPMQTGTNGLILLGNNYPDVTEAPWVSFKSPATAVGDPVGCKSEELPDDDGLSVHLVVNYVDPVSNDGVEKPDFDIDDDGTLDWAEASPPANAFSPKTGNLMSPYLTAPYTPFAPGVPFMDSIGFDGLTSTALRRSYATANLSVSLVSLGGDNDNLHPWSLSRWKDHFVGNSAVGWYGGKIAGTTTDLLSTALSGTAAERFNIVVPSRASFTGSATPGVLNFSAAPPTPLFRITEINLNPPGTPGLAYDSTGQFRPNDGNYEYIEISNTATSTDKAASLSGYALVLLNSTGELEEHWDLTKFATGSNGILLLGDRYPEGYCPFSKIVDPATNYGDPSAPNYAPGTRVTYTSLNQGDIGSNNGYTLYLVRNSLAFKTESTGVDKDYDTDDDGALNTTAAVAFGTVIDSISSGEITVAGTPALVPNRGGYSAAKLNLNIGGTAYNPDNFSRKMTSATAFNATVNATASWMCGRLGARNESALFYRTGFASDALRGNATPGKVNQFTAVADPVAGSLLLNEVHVNPGGSPDNAEFVELISTVPFQRMPNCWLVFATASATERGTVTKVLDLRNMNTGSNRLAAFGDGIEETSFPLFNEFSALTVRDDPQSFASTGVENVAPGANFTPDSLDNTGVAVFLIVNPTAIVVGTDLDPDNDGVFTRPWAVTLDAISSSASLGEAAKAGSHGLAATSVHNISRYFGNVSPLSAAAWFGGELQAGAAATTTLYGMDIFGTFKGAASPGRLNPTAEPVSAANVLINEIMVNPPGGDNNKEFIELRSTNGAVNSLNGYSLLFIDNLGNETGTVQKVIELDGSSTGSNGLAILGAGYNTAIPWIGANAPDAATNKISPDGLFETDIGRSTDNGAFCAVLVRNFRGRVGDDLDIGSTLNPNASDDHNFDIPTRWSSLSDGVALKIYVEFDLGEENPDSAPSDNVPSSIEGHVFPGIADLTQAVTITGANQYLVLPSADTYNPDTFARYLGDAAISRNAWYGGDLLGTASLTVAYDTIERFPVSFSQGVATPGKPNIAAYVPPTDDSDLDGDGVKFLMEIALGMDPEVADSPKLPKPSYGIVSGYALNQPLFRVTRPAGGVAGITYTTQASVDLVNWDVPLSLHSTVAGPNATETQTWVINSFSRTAVLAEKRLFFREQVSR